jgi:integrase
VELYSVEEVRAILTSAEQVPNKARWAIALALGLRQGEVLGLRWPDVDLDRGLLLVRNSRVRPVYQHGCGGTCGRMPGWCRQRVLVNGEAGDTKSRAGRRAVGLPAPLVQLLREHREQQRRDRQHARQLCRESGYVFTSPTGQPLNPNSDYHRWKALLKSAGVRDARLHDARHTAATMLLVLGVPVRTVMGIMGWSSTSMAARYQHVTDLVRHCCGGPDLAACCGPIRRPAEMLTEPRTETTAVIGVYRSRDRRTSCLVR